ncbi:MAG: CvpA family protein [Clostridia bacterium]|nr:CvpA family protein [Clostridia bacterium]
MSYSYGRPRPAAATINRLPIIILFGVVALFLIADLLLGFDFNWVDYAVVIIIALFGFKGYLKGLINTVFSLAGYVVGLIFAFIFSPKLALLAMQKTTLGKTIGDKLNDLIPTLSTINTIKVSDANSTLELMNKNPQLNQAVSSNPLLKQVMSVTNSAAQTGSMYQDTVVTVNDLIVFTILKVLALVVIFIVVKLLVVLAGRLLTSVLSSSAVLGTANRTGGMAIGLGVGLLICYVVFIFAIPTLGSLNIIKVPETYTQSLVLTWFNKLVGVII